MDPNMLATFMKQMEENNKLLRDMQAKLEEEKKARESSELEIKRLNTLVASLQSAQPSKTTTRTTDVSKIQVIKTDSPKGEIKFIEKSFPSSKVSSVEKLPSVEAVIKQINKEVSIVREQGYIKTEAKPLSKKQKEKEKRKAKKQRQRDAKKVTQVKTVEKPTPKTKAPKKKSSQSNKQKKKERKQKLKEKYLKKKERKQKLKEKQVKPIDSRSSERSRAEEKELIVEEEKDDGNPGFTQVYEDKRGDKAIFYYLKVPTDLDDTGINHILDSIEVSYQDFSKRFPNVKVERVNCTVSVRIMSNKPVIRNDEQNLKFGDLGFPNFDRVKATNFLKNNAEKFAVSDKWLEPFRVMLYFIRDPWGGCYTQEGFKHDFKCLNNEGYKLKNPKSTNNNCFFYALKPEFKERGVKLTKGYCNEIRSLYGLKKDSKISIKSAEQIAKEILNLEIGIMNHTEEYFNKQCETNLFLVDEHYMRIDGKLQKCEYCGEKYYRVHDEKACASRVTFLSHKFDNRKRYPLAKKLRQKKWIKRNELGKREENKYILHYDIETYRVDEHGRSIPNCVGFCYYLDMENPPVFYEVITGEDCMDRFAMRLRDEDLMHIQWVNAFNGSKFDHLYLVQAEERLADLGRVSPLITSSGVISGKVGLRKLGKDKNGVMQYGMKTLVDISRHLVDTLKANLETLGCVVQKGDFDHTLNGPWDSLSENVKEDLLKYLKSDVMGLMELSDKIHEGFVKKYGTSWVHFLSTSHASYNIWLDSIAEEYLREEKVLLPSVKQYEFIKKSIYGGRCQVHRKYFKSSDVPSFECGEAHDSFSYKTNMTVEQLRNIKDYCLDLDVSSLYPHAMTFDMPLGIPFESKEYLPDKLGIYKVKFTTNKKLMTSPLPSREKGELMWDLEDREGYYTSIDIETAKHFGYSFEILEGLVWPEKGPIFKDYIQEMYKTKNSAEKGTAEYMLAKLMMNSLYGKTIQRPRIEKTFYVSKRSDWNKILPNYYIDTIDSHSFEDTWIVKATPKDQQLVEKAISKPAQFGSFILAYSRRIMMDYIEKLNPNQEKLKQFFYTDTDSLQCHISQANNIDLTQEGLGFMTNDLGKSAKIIEGIWVSPKMYLLRYLVEENGVVLYKEHRVGKGVKKDKGYEIKKGIRKDKGIIPLAQEDYKTMLDGNSKEIKNKDVFKRFTYRVNKSEREKGTKFFSVSIRDDVKVLNRTLWAGRVFDENLNSVPIGYTA